ncbi:MAG TPA: SPFH domain-containing protein [Candidatus Eisenbacteria bacterium]|nr:SPFH domain-containing protein [Candidatus Eisenbacteria bacterium]
MRGFFGVRGDKEPECTIECPLDAPDTLVSRYSLFEDDVRQGAALFVRPAQKAVFVYEGRLGDAYGPGRYRLSAENMPVLASLRHWHSAFPRSFRPEIYFFNLRNFSDLGWETPGAIPVRDAELGQFSLSAHGRYTFCVQSPEAVLACLGEPGDLCKIGRLEPALRQAVLAALGGIFGDSEIPFADFAHDLAVFSDKLWFMIAPEFAALGLKLVQFSVEDLYLPPDVQRTLDRRATAKLLQSRPPSPQARAVEGAAAPGGDVRVVVRCASCATLNAEEAKFCSECGAPMQKKK